MEENKMYFTRDECLELLDSWEAWANGKASSDQEMDLVEAVPWLIEDIGYWISIIENLLNLIPEGEDFKCFACDGIGEHHWGCMVQRAWETLDRFDS